MMQKNRSMVVYSPPPLLRDACADDLADFVAAGRTDGAAFFQRITLRQSEKKSGGP